MTKRYKMTEDVRGAVVIDSPGAASFCLGEGESLPVDGTCDSSTTCVWVKLLDPDEDCASYDENPFEAGADQYFPDSAGNWSAGSISPGADGFGDRCVVVWSIDNGSNPMTMIVRNFTFLAPDDPACSGSGSGGGSASGTGAAAYHQVQRARRRSAPAQAAVQPAGRGQPVIRDAAPRAYRVHVPAGAVQLPEPLASLLDAGGGSLAGAVLEFDASRSSHRRATWRSAGRRAAWTLKVRRQGGTLVATLTLFRLGRRSVRAPLVWCGSWCFRKQKLQLSGARGSRLPSLVVEASA